MREFIKNTQKILTPHLSQVISGDWIVHRRFEEAEKLSEKDNRFCLDFTIESALSLQSIDTYASECAASRPGLKRRSCWALFVMEDNTNGKQKI